MSRPSFPYLPNPDKWIDTAPYPKRSTQRPLTAFNNSFATPPATLRRNAAAGPGPSSSAMRWAKTDDIPMHDSVQTTLKGFLTPPDTTSEPRKRATRVGRSRLREENLSHRGSPLPRASGKEGQRKGNEDDYWRSDELAEDNTDEGDGSTKGRVRQAKKTASLGHSSSSDVIDLSVDDDPPPPPPATIPSSSLPPARLPSPPTSRTPPISSEPEHPLSERQLTPVPADILAIHRRLCGGNPGRRRGRSPWRQPGDPDPTPEPKKRKKLDNTEEVTRRALEKAGGKGKPAKPLVRLSDEDSPPRKRGLRAMPLTSIPPNALSASRLSPMSRWAEKKATARVEGTTGRMSSRSRSPFKPLSLEGRIADATDLARTPRERDPPINHLGRYAVATPSRTVRTRVRPIRGPSPLRLEPPPSPPSPPSSTPSDHPTPPVLTPRRRTSPHHQVTPPKYTTPTKSRRWEEHLETLFDFPPPPQPHFVREYSEESSENGFVPAAMDPETLMTWSLGPAANLRGKGQSRTKLDVAGDKEVPVDGGSQRRPSIHPLGKHRTPQQRREAGSLDRVGTESVHDSSRNTAIKLNDKQIAPSNPSQSFHRLIPSSPPLPDPSPSPAPQKRPLPSGSVERLFSEEGPDVAAPADDLSKKRTESSWRNLERGVLSALPEPQPVASSSSAVSTKRKRYPTASRRSETGEQSKLAAFGFFKDRKVPKVVDFGREWEAEEDLEVEPVGLDEDDTRRPQKSAHGHGGLRPVPEAPYHPSLRPAGIMELQRRQRAEAASSAVDQADVADEEESLPFPVLDRRSSTDNSSSLTTEAEEVGGAIPGMSHSTREWWDKIAQRRSSEFDEEL